MNLKATPTLPSRPAQEHLCSPDGGCAKPFTKVTEVDSCAYRARAQHALLCSARSAALRQPSAGTLGFAGAGAMVRQNLYRFPRSKRTVFAAALRASLKDLAFWPLDSCTYVNVRAAARSHTLHTPRGMDDNIYMRRRAGGPARAAHQHEPALSAQRVHFSLARLLLLAAASACRLRRALRPMTS